MSTLKDELLGLVIGVYAAPLIIPVYLGYHFFYKEKSVVPEKEFKQGSGTVISK